MKKYAIHPGWVGSKFDGDSHFITYSQLIRLCMLNPRECVCVKYDDDRGCEFVPGINLDELRHFYPSYHGLYNRDGR